MPSDPVTDAALGPLRDILQRYLQVVDVLVSAVDALDQQPQPESEPTGARPQSTHERQPSVTSIGQRGDLQTILAFQKRLSEVSGVAAVTLEGSDDRGFRFLVEMDKPPH